MFQEAGTVGGKALRWKVAGHVPETGEVGAAADRQRRECGYNID